MIDLYGVLQEQETVNGELGLGVDYYKGEKGEQGIPGKDGKDGSDQVYVGADEPTDERVKLWIDTDATPSSKTVSWDEIENKPEIPAPYTLPTASTSTLGGVKVDGNTITIADGVISSVGSAEPDAYIKDASVSGNTLTLTKKDNTNVVFTPSGGSSGGSGYILPTASPDRLGGIKVYTHETMTLNESIGAAVQFNENHAEVAYVPYATYQGLYPGVVRVEASNGLKYKNGLISMSPATTTTQGTVAYDGKTIQAKVNSINQLTLYVPTATTSSLGVVKPDGTTVTVDDKGNLSMIGKPAAIRTLITGQAPDWVVGWVANPDNYIVMVNNCVVFSTIKSGTNFYYYWIDGDRIEHYYIKFTDTTFTTPDSSQPDYNMAATQLITESNWQNYITVSSGSDWQYTQDQYDSNLYNAKEMIIYWEYNNEYRMNYYNFTYNSNLASYTYQTFNTKCDYNNGNSTWQYDGSSINTSNMNIQVIYYKT